MKLNEVKINNFRNVLNKEFTTCSFTILEGKNMSGKTNTLNAIYWALTGVDLEGSKENRTNFPFGSEDPISVELVFDTFSFKRTCEYEDGTPTTSLYINGEKAKTNKTGEALIHAKLGVTDLVLTAPKDFNIVRFLIDPLYFDTISPSALRKFLYMLSGIDFKQVADKQNKAVSEMLAKRQVLDPYKLLDAIDKDKKATKKVIDGCKTARSLFPSIEAEAQAKEKEETKKLTQLENEQALAEKYALAVSKEINKYYWNAMGIKVCLLEKGVGEDVWKDVCYPILPKSGLPFHLGSQAEKTYVGIKFIQEVCLTYDIKPLPILIDNMESLDENTTRFVNELGVQYIGALVK